MAERGGKSYLADKNLRENQRLRRDRWAGEAKRNREAKRQQATEFPVPQATSQTERPRIIYLPQHTETSPSESHETATKSPQLTDRTIAFIQHSYAAGADEELDERRRLLLARAAAEPHKTLQELAPYAGVSTKERVRQLSDTGIRTLYEADPPELQQRYDLNSLLRSRHKGAREGVPMSAETKARLILASHSAPRKLRIQRIFSDGILASQRP
jgi:hypothetical protein